MTSAARWLPWPEPILVFFLTNIQGSPTTIYGDMTQYPYNGTNFCNEGFVEYSGVSSVNAIAGPTLVQGNNPSIMISPKARSEIWVYAADIGVWNTIKWGALLNSGYTGVIDNWSGDDMGAWQSNGLVPVGTLTLNFTAPQALSGQGCTYGNPPYPPCPSMLAAVALQP